MLYNEGCYEITTSHPHLKKSVKVVQLGFSKKMNFRVQNHIHQVDKKYSSIV